MIVTPLEHPLAGFTLAAGSREALKWAAAILMVLDHVNAHLLGASHPVLYALGRLAFPLFAVVLAPNLATADRAALRRVLGRLGVFGLAAQPFTMLLRSPLMEIPRRGSGVGGRVRAARMPVGTDRESEESRDDERERAGLFGTWKPSVRQPSASRAAASRLPANRVRPVDGVQYPKGLEEACYCPTASATHFLMKLFFAAPASFFSAAAVSHALAASD